jgi:hypothetical protein
MHTQNLKETPASLSVKFWDRSELISLINACTKLGLKFAYCDCENIPSEGEWFSIFSQAGENFQKIVKVGHLLNRAGKVYFASIRRFNNTTCLDHPCISCPLYRQKGGKCDNLLRNYDKISHWITQAFLCQFFYSQQGEN